MAPRHACKSAHHPHGLRLTAFRESRVRNPAFRYTESRKAGHVRDGIADPWTWPYSKIAVDSSMISSVKSFCISPPFNSLLLQAMIQITRHESIAQQQASTSGRSWCNFNFCSLSYQSPCSLHDRYPPPTFFGRLYPSPKNSQSHALSYIPRTRI
jgi:hypothetical protein